MWKSSVETAEILEGTDTKLEIAACYALARFWHYAILSESYVADDRWIELIQLSPEGENILKRMKPRAC
jgi:hypothetical protein